MHVAFPSSAPTMRECEYNQQCKINAKFSYNLRLRLPWRTSRFLTLSLVEPCVEIDIAVLRELCKPVRVRDPFYGGCRCGIEQEGSASNVRRNKAVPKLKRYKLN